MTHWDQKTLPEICMLVHMECTGSAQDHTVDDLRAAVAYLRGRVDRWQVMSNGARWAPFDTAVLMLCLATISDAEENLDKFTTPAIA